MNTPSTRLSTRFGPIRIVPLARTRLHIKSVENEDGGAPLVIHRVPHTFQAWLTYADGDWHVTQDCGFFLHRVVTGLKDNTASRSAIDTAREVLLPAIVTWAKANPRDFEIAEAMRLAQELTRKDNEIASTEDALADLRTTRVALAHNLQALQDALDLDLTTVAATAA